MKREVKNSSLPDMWVVYRISSHFRQGKKKHGGPVCTLYTLKIPLQLKISFGRKTKTRKKNTDMGGSLARKKSNLGFTNSCQGNKFNCGQAGLNF